MSNKTMIELENDMKQAKTIRLLSPKDLIYVYALYDSNCIQVSYRNWKTYYKVVHFEKKESVIEELKFQYKDRGRDAVNQAINWFFGGTRYYNG